MIERRDSGMLTVGSGVVLNLVTVVAVVCPVLALPLWVLCR